MIKNNPKKGNYLNILLKSSKTIFSTKDISLLWNEENSVAVRNRLNDYVNNNKLIRVRKGFYAKDQDYNKYELATKIYTPSYISFETVLFEEGVIFQNYSNSVFIASYLSREIKIEDSSYNYKKIKDNILTNEKGLLNKGNFYKASLERAFLDTVYLNKGYYFDNLTPINWKRVFEILPIYKNKSMEKRINKYKENA